MHPSCCFFFKLKLKSRSSGLIRTIFEQFDLLVYPVLHKAEDCLQLFVFGILISSFRTNRTSLDTWAGGLLGVGWIGDGSSSDPPALTGSLSV